MSKIPVSAACALALANLLAPPPARAAAPPVVPPWVAQWLCNYSLLPDLTYRTVAGRELKLDLYLQCAGWRPPATGGGAVPAGLVGGPVPVVYYIHGGAWAHGTRSWELGYILPWLALGWDVVSVDYRLSGVARAPAAVEDCFCGYHWVAQHAAQYHFDLNRLVVTGASAGGNLACLVGMAPTSSGFDRDCHGPLPKAAAIVSIAGVYDVAEMLSGPEQRPFAVDWIGSAEGVDLARRVSPLSYVRPELPPVFFVHGDSDRTVPYEQALRLRAALDKAGVPNQFLTIAKGGHGAWRPEDYTRLYASLSEFLTHHHLSPAAREPDPGITLP